MGLLGSSCNEQLKACPDHQTTCLVEINEDGGIQQQRTKQTVTCAFISQSSGWVWGWTVLLSGDHTDATPGPNHTLSRKETLTVLQGSWKSTGGGGTLPEPPRERLWNDVCYNPLPPHSSSEDVYWRHDTYKNQSSAYLVRSYLSIMLSLSRTFLISTTLPCWGWPESTQWMKKSLLLTYALKNAGEIKFLPRTSGDRSNWPSTQCISVTPMRQLSLQLCITSKEQPWFSCCGAEKVMSSGTNRKV